MSTAPSPPSTKGDAVYALDTCICIDFLRGRMPYAYEMFKHTDPRLFAIPSIVEAELLLGAEKSANPSKRRQTVEEFLLSFQVLPFDHRCAYAYAKLRSTLEREGRRIGPNDLIVAATALANECTLVTNNVEEFKRVPGLPLESWYEMDLSDL